jgi:hypothetical protein
MHVEIKGFDVFKEIYQKDSYFGPILKQTMAEQQAGYTLQSGFLFKENQLCIPECSLREKIVKELHEGGYFGRDKTMALISSSYWWPKPKGDVTRFVVAMCVKDLANMFFKEVVSLHGIPFTITSYRDPKFMSHFWRTLWRLIEIELCISSSYHPQSNGEIEVFNCSLGNVLCFLAGQA